MGTTNNISCKQLLSDSIKIIKEKKKNKNIQIKQRQSIHTQYKIGKVHI